MIDTIVLTLTKGNYHISAPDKFVPSARWAVAEHAPKGMVSQQNSTKKELCSGVYKPQLTLSNKITPHGVSVQMLKIQFSVPKLLFGNNFDELQYKDFQEIAKHLQSSLKKMGVVTTIETLAHAPVSAVHYSKNISLTDGEIPYHYIEKIKEANISLSCDVNQTDYRNTGHSYRFHCNAYEVVFYDKIKDLEQACKSHRRALEKDSTIQLNLLNQLKQRKKLEILRMEVRLNKRQKIKELFNKLGIKADLTFKKIFKPAIAKKILVYYLDEIEKKRPLLLDLKKTNTKSLLAALIINNPTLGPQKTFQLLGLKYALESVTFRELRNMFAHCTKRSWYKLMNDTQGIIVPLTPSPFWKIRKNIQQFKALKIKNVKLRNH